MNDESQEAGFSASLYFSIESINEEMLCERLKSLGNEGSGLFANVGANSRDLLFRNDAGKFHWYRKIEVQFEGLIKRFHSLNKTVLNCLRKPGAA